MAADNIEEPVPDLDKNCSTIENGEQSEEKLISKHQLKRMKRYEERMKKRPEWRAKEREKRKARVKALKEQGVELGPSRKKLKKNSMENSSCHLEVAIDCSFDDLMSDRQILNLVQQLQYCYATNRRVPNPLQFYITSVNDKTLTRLEQVGPFRNWDIHYREDSFLEVFPKDRIVYLSSESSNVLKTLDDDKTYIIGGLVDHNHHKGLCHKLAVERGLQHARLPIDEHAEMRTRKVLTINHVFEILVKYTETKSWEDALSSVIPLRKGLKVLTKSDQASEKSAEEDHTKGCTVSSDQNKN